MPGTASKTARLTARNIEVAESPQMVDGVLVVKARGKTVGTASRQRVRFNPEGRSEPYYEWRYVARLIGATRTVTSRTKDGLRQNIARRLNQRVGV